MKNLTETYISRLIMILGIICSCLCLTACGDDDDDVIWDFAGVNVNLNLIDSEGNNLLDPGVTGNWFGKTMWIEYEGQRYDARWTSNIPGREYLAHFEGFHVEPGLIKIDDKYEYSKTANHLVSENFRGTRIMPRT